MVFDAAFAPHPPPCAPFNKHSANMECVALCDQCFQGKVTALVRITGERRARRLRAPCITIRACITIRTAVPAEPSVFLADIHYAIKYVSKTLFSRGAPVDTHGGLRDVLWTLQQMAVVPPEMTWWAAEEMAGKLRQVALVLLRMLPGVDHPGVHPTYKTWLTAAVQSAMRAVDVMTAFLRRAKAPL